MYGNIHNLLNERANAASINDTFGKIINAEEESLAEEFGLLTTGQVALVVKKLNEEKMEFTEDDEYYLKIAAGEIAAEFGDDIPEEDDDDYNSPFAGNIPATIDYYDPSGGDDEFVEENAHRVISQSDLTLLAGK